MRSLELKGAAIARAIKPMSASLGATRASAAVPLAFPAEQNLIPSVVGGAFVLPAVLAVAYAMLCRIGREFGSVIGVCMLAVVVKAIAGLLQPGLLRES